MPLQATILFLYLQTRNSLSEQTSNMALTWSNIVSLQTTFELSAYNTLRDGKLGPQSPGACFMLPKSLPSASLKFALR